MNKKPFVCKRNVCWISNIRDQFSSHYFLPVNFYCSLHSSSFRSCSRCVWMELSRGVTGRFSLLFGFGKSWFYQVLSLEFTFGFDIRSTGNKFI